MNTDDIIRNKNLKYNSDVTVICKIPAKEILEREYGIIMNDDVVLTDERSCHIDKGRKRDAGFMKTHLKETIEDYDYLLDAGRGCVKFIKTFDEGKDAIIVWLSLSDRNKANSILSGERINRKELNRLLRKNRIIDKRD